MRSVLVTGGAKRLGAAIARALAMDGWRVVVHYRSSHEAAHALADEIAGVAVEGDLGRLDDMNALFDRARRAVGGPIEGLVNSASAFEFDRPPQVDRALLDRLGAVNMGAPALLACALARQADVARGSVVNLLDQKVANQNPDFFSYSCAKLGLAGATTMLSTALAPAVRVNAVSPGLTLPSGDQSAAEFSAVASRNLLGRPVGADAVADAVAFLLDAQRVTGQNLFVDCGQRFCPRDRDVMFERARG